MPKSLARRLELRDVVAISLSTMLGSGIFVLPGLAFAKAGPSMWLAYLLAGVAAMPAIFSKAELATAMPFTGGTYVYLERAYGPLAGTISGLGLWLSLLLKSSFALVGFAAYLWVFTELPVVPTALTLLTLIVMLNVRGVKAVGRVQVVAVTLAIAGLSVLLMGGLFAYDRAHLTPHFSEGFGGTLAATGMVFISYAGVTKIAAIAEEVRRPHRNLPWGMLISAGIAVLLYASLALGIVAAVPAERLTGDLRPVHSFADGIGGAVVGIPIAVIAVLTMTSMANGGLLAASRFPFAMSRDRLLPDALSGVSARWRTPVLSILTTGSVMVVAIATLDVEKLAKLASSFMILAFMAVNGTVVLLRESRTHWYRPRYRSPLYPWIQVFGVLSGMALLVAMGLISLLATLAIAIFGGLLFRAYGKRRADRRGVFRLLAPRQELLTAESLPPDLEEALGIAAPVAVSLFGRERSPETIVEMGAALADGRALEVLHVLEVPEQMSTKAALAADVHSISLERRLGAMAEEQGINLHFDTAVSRDVARTVLAASTRLHCEWLVMEWRGRSDTRRIVRNPRGWLHDNLACNLGLFRDAGVRYFRKILVYAVPGPHDALVVSTADHLAEIHDGELTFVGFVRQDAPQTEVQAVEAYLDQLSGLCSRSTRQRILTGRGPRRSVAQETVDYDLLIMGSSAGSTLSRRVFGAHEDKIIADASCSVLSLKTPRTQTHEAFEPDKADIEESQNLLDYLEPALVTAHLDVKSKDLLFSRFAENLAAIEPNVTDRSVADALWERERSQNTALGFGVAIPHAVIVDLERTVVGLYTTDGPLDYQAPDGEPVDVLFFFAGPLKHRSLHLVLLSNLSRLVQDTSVLGRLRKADSPENLVAAIERAVAAQERPNDSDSW